MRKVYVNVTVKMIVNLEEGETVENLVQEMDYEFGYYPDDAENRIIDTEITEIEVTDSK